MKVCSELTDIPEVAQYLRRIKAGQRGIRSAAIIKSDQKYPKDLCVLRFADDGEITLYSEDADGTLPYLPTEVEKLSIKGAFTQWRFPKSKVIVDITKTKDMPKQLMEAAQDDIFEFRETNRNIIMLQQRINPKKPGEEKRYIPWTYWEDDKWRALEPDDELLPLYGLETVGAHTTVFIHEGAKAARAVQRIVASDDYHPWKEELSAGAHIGWIGGARAPRRTNWQRLIDLGVKRVYVVSDNDTPGVQAVGPISQGLRCQCIHLQFTAEWPSGFDLADKFPKEMFVSYNDQTVYVGPAFRTLLHPATWMTDEVVSPRGKKSYFLRPHVAEEFVYVHHTRHFIHKHFPRFRMNEDDINAYYAPLSGTFSTGRLLRSRYDGVVRNISYKPGQKSGIISDGSTSSINVHVPTDIKPISGDIEPFMKFMRYLLPEEIDRKYVLRWVATLIARPEVKMLYGVLMVSRMQGVGKTMLGSLILGHLVGKENVSHPSESMIVDTAFNGWLAEKRLVVINEIYAGHSWKAYHKLKSVLTDDTISVNEKFEKSYDIENWAHFYCCSNSMEALKIENDDRRWLIPKVTEIRWPKEEFDEFLQWLKGAGLGVIKHWAENYGEYIQPGSTAPMTDLKAEMIYDSRAPEYTQIDLMVDHIHNNQLEVVLTPSQIFNWIETTSKGKRFATERQLKSHAMEAGLKMTPYRYKLQGKPQNVLVSPILWQKYPEYFEQTEHSDKTRELIGQHLKHPQDLFPMQ